MNNSIKFFQKAGIALAFIGGTFIFSGCNSEEFLNPVPITTISDASAFATPARILNQVNGLYNNLQNGNFYGGRFQVYHDIRGEEFLNETTNGVTGLQTWNHTLVASTNEVNNLWNQIYFTINNCNLFIEGVEANKAIVGNDALANNYIAEARFIRGLCYYSLLTLYSRPFADGNGSKLGVPLRLKGEKSDGGNDLARATVAETYAQILTDLNFAETNLPANYSSALLNTTRAHKNTAIAFKTRVYLSMQRYNDVITEANKLVPTAAPFKAASGVAHELQADISKTFAAPHTTTESIFSMPFTENDLPGTQNGLGSYYNPGPKGIGDFSLNLTAAGIINNAAFNAGDARKKMVTAVGTKTYLTKFPLGPQHLDYAPVIRYAEVLLNAAEAIARTSGVNDRAIALLNAIRTRSDASKTFTAADFADTNAFISALLLERRMELLGEGLRSLDCTRLLLPIPGKANVATILPTQPDYIWPIPQSELIVNKACLPNN